MRLLLILVFFTVSAPACAEWVKYRENDSGTRFYYDPASIRKQGDIRLVWVLQDREVSKNGMLSTRMLNEYDCKGKVFRMTNLSCYSGQMATGKLLCSDDGPISKWIPIKPQSIFEQFLRTVCQ